MLSSPSLRGLWGIHPIYAHNVFNRSIWQINTTSSFFSGCQRGPRINEPWWSKEVFFFLFLSDMSYTHISLMIENRQQQSLKIPNLFRHWLEGLIRIDKVRYHYDMSIYEDMFQECLYFTEAMAGRSSTETARRLDDIAAWQGGRPLKWKILQRIWRDTLLETNSSPLNIGLPNRKVVFQASIFRGELLVSGMVCFKGSDLDFPFIINFGSKDSAITACMVLYRTHDQDKRQTVWNTHLQNWTICYTARHFRQLHTEAYSVRTFPRKNGKASTSCESAGVIWVSTYVGCNTSINVSKPQACSVGYVISAYWCPHGITSSIYQTDTQEICRKMVTHLK